MKNPKTQLITVASLFVCLVGLSVSAKTTHSRSWLVPGTQPSNDIEVQTSGDDEVVRCHMVSFRCKYANFDKWGKLTLYPVVKAPNGKLYRGLVRTYSASTFGDRWVKWAFPVEFRDPASHVKTWNDAIDTDTLSPIGLPAGEYQVKWVANDRLFDPVSSFQISPKS